MKNIFQYIGLFVFSLFSFYYTNKVVELANSKDPIMKEINKYASTVNHSCIEGYTLTDGIILGVNGHIVDEEESYANMKGYGFNEDLIVFKEEVCLINKDDNYDKYIIKGNDYKNSVSILILVNNGMYLKEIESISKHKDVKIGFIVNGSLINDNREYFHKLYDEKYSISYGGINKDDFNKFKTIMKTFNKNNKFYCVKNNNFDIIRLCEKEKINSVSSKYYYNKNYLLNTKNNLDKGNIYIYKESYNLIREFSSILNHIKGKGYKIVSLDELLRK